MRHNIIVASAPGNFTKQIKRAPAGNQCEVKSLLDRFVAPTEGQVGWRPAQIGIQRSKGRHEPGNILRSASINYIEIAGQTRRTMADSRGAADDDELDAGLRERADQASKISLHDWPAL